MSSTSSTSASSSTSSTEAVGSVPPGYQSLYATLQGQLTAFSAQVPNQRVRGGTILASGLEAADGNAMHPGVLRTNLLATAIDMVHLMRSMGETGVTIQVSFPLLLSSFPDNQEYRTFYEDVANSVHQSGMTLTVEENPLFGNFSPIPMSAFYSSLSPVSYASDDQQMAQTIIDVMRPRYLSILNEPDTYTAVIRNRSIDLNSPSSGAAFVNSVLGGLRRDGTLVGAGTGSWTDASYDRSLLQQTSIDFLDIHTYPVAPTTIASMNTQVALAASAHKPVVMSECWLYKESTNGFPVDSVQAAPNEQKIGTFSFWEPLDQRFLTAMVSYARSRRFVLVSPFSTLNFFAYQDWTPALEAQSSRQVRASFYQAVLRAMSSGELSAVGRTYKALAS